MTSREYKNNVLGFSIQVPEELFENGLIISESYYGHRGSMIYFFISKNGEKYSPFLEILSIDVVPLKTSEESSLVSTHKNNRYIFKFLGNTNNPWIPESTKSLMIYNSLIESSFKAFSVEESGPYPGEEGMD